MSEHQLPGHLLQSLKEREQKGLLRKLKKNYPAIDFCSNDYLGFSKQGLIKEEVGRQKSEVRSQKSEVGSQKSEVGSQKAEVGSQKSEGRSQKSEVRSQKSEVGGGNFGATGSRLISGNSEVTEEVEKQIALFHHAESALIFNSGYDANVGLFSSVPQKNDLVLFDECIHASIYDGIRLSHATHYKFKHNQVQSLQELIHRHKPNYNNIYIAVESVYSMDGDTAPLLEIADLCARAKNIFLIVDEAHATGVFGKQGRGYCNALGIEKKCFARVYTYGKALGCHGAAVVGSNVLRTYLINFARSFIYTTSLPEHSVVAIQSAYKLLIETNRQDKLQENIACFYSKTAGLKNFIKSQSAIHSFIVGSSAKALELEKLLEKNNIFTKAIRSPTVKEGSERIRICLHAFNTKEEIDLLIQILRTYQ